MGACLQLRCERCGLGVASNRRVQAVSAGDKILLALLSTLCVLVAGVATLEAMLGIQVVGSSVAAFGFTCLAWLAAGYIET